MLRSSSNIRLGARYEGYAYQVDAVEAVKGLPYSALFHEQGLGKTKIGVDLALEWLRTEQVDSVLVVTKRGLIVNWVDEVRAHTFLRPRILDQHRSANFFALNSPSRLYLTHYEAVKSEERRLALFTKTRRVAAILDESQKIKNPTTELSKVFHRLSDGFSRRVIMTGTPIANRPFDLWSQIFFLDKGESLGTDFDEFRYRFDLSNDLWKNDSKRKRFEQELTEVFNRIRPFTVRETKGTAGIDLPEKHIENLIIALEPRQRELYEQIRTELRASVFRNGQVVVDDAEDILKRLLRLVQLASNPALVDQSYQEIPGKFPHLRDLVERAVSGGSKVIVWTTFVDNANWLHRELGEFGSVAVHGNLAMEARQEALQSFKSDDQCRVLVATPASAKEGLTLTVANQAIFYDRSFSLDDYLQAQDRIHRISQTQTCFVWNLLGEDTVDEWVESLLAAKRLAAQLGQADIDANEYQRLVNYDFGRIVREILGLEEREAA
jgi:SNF2 family DNA or RNA helicase